MGHRQRNGKRQARDGADAPPFWRSKSLAEMTTDEWEQLCDGCGKCCLEKLEDIDTGEIHYTNVACRLLDMNNLRCRRYTTRQRWVPTCAKLTPENIQTLSWMPSTCAYRLLARGEDLPAWHPLITGEASSTHAAGQSARGRIISERTAGPLHHHIVSWPA